jgi:5-methylcytosine-specific restriction endonuclease McrA
MNARARGDWQGMNWIRQEKRLAIYLRDGCACVWCGAKVEEGAQLTLDHVRCHSAGGSNAASNLVTACKRCNDSRGARSAGVREGGRGLREPRGAGSPYPPARPDALEAGD